MIPKFFDATVAPTQFDLVEVAEEGILLHRESGAFYRLNASARVIWAALIAGEPIPSIAERLARTFRISSSQAERDTYATLTEPVEAVTSHPIDARYRWIPTSQGYDFLVDESLVCRVDERGDFVRLFIAPQLGAGEARIQLRSVVPKLLALRGIRALHASAVDIGGSLVVFSGPSGAGKTTTAKAIAEAGAVLVSEDLMILREVDDCPQGVLPAERIIRSWVADESARWARQPDVQIDCRTLDRALEGEGRPLQRIFLIDARRRGGDRLTSEPLSQPDALIALIDSFYFASIDAERWRYNFDSLRRLVTFVPTARAVMPLGLAALRQVAKAFVTDR